MKILAPVKDFNGTVGSVVFSNGVGETDDAHEAAYFARHGYTLTKETPAKRNTK